MLRKVILAENALEPDTWETHEVEDICAFLYERFDAFPDTARIYHNQVAENCDITPSDEGGIERLTKLEGTFYVIVYPADPVTAIVAIVAVVVAVAAYVYASNIPTPALRNTQTESPNNELSDRQNRPRPGGRIPDIYGTVRSTPDLLSVPYKVFENHEEVEYAYMAIGRGSYSVPAAEVKDDTTLVSDIVGASVEIFAPNTSPLSEDDPQLRIGTAIDEPLYLAKRSNSVNGQVLRAPNSDSVTGNFNIKFNSPDEILLKSGSGIDFTEFFAASDVVTITNAQYTGTITGSGVTENASVRFTSSGTIEFESTNTNAYTVGDTLIVSGAFFTYNSGANAINLDGTYAISGKTTSTLTLSSPSSINTDWTLIAGNFVDDQTSYKTCTLEVPSGETTIDLAGTYTLLSVSSSILVLSNPAAVNSDWNTLTNFNNGETAFISPIIATSGSKWVGPFTLEEDRLTDVFANFVALNGLYKDDGEQQIRFDITVELELTPVDNDGNPIGSAQVFQGVLEGSAKTKSTRAVTIKARPSAKGKHQVRARRVTNADLDFEGSIVDEVKWRDVFAMARLMYSFKDGEQGWYAYGGSPNYVDAVNGKLIAYENGGAAVGYGAQTNIRSVSAGDTVTVSFTASDFNSISTIQVGLQGTGGWVSNNFTLGEGRHTVKLLASNNSTRLLFFSSIEAGSFAIDDVSISVNNEGHLTDPHFGDITTIHSVTYATAGALAVKDRKLNMLATRKIAGVDRLTEDFTVDEGDFYPYAVNASLSVVANQLVTAHTSGSNYGCQINIPDFKQGATVKVTFDLVNLVSPTTSVEVGLQGGGAGWASIGSNKTLITTGTHAVTLTATRNASNGRVLFYSAQNDGSFTIDNVVIYVETTERNTTSSTSKILTALCLDPFIGNRPIAEIDYENFYDTVDQIEAYFGTPLASEFNYTFDSDNLSFEETIASVASAIHCNAYRRGSQIKLSFEKETDVSTLLFNHRNKLPGSETRTVRFGNQNSNDGIEYTYIDPSDDSLVTFYLPEDQSSVNPKKVESLGIRNKLQAYFHAWRLWNKIRYQNVATEFDATQEADILITADRILVADNTRTGTQDGEVISQSGLILELSQEITFVSGKTYAIFLQHIDGTVESIGITAGSSSRLVVLANAPKAPLSLEEDAYARALYQVVANDDAREQAFLLTEKDPQGNFNSTIRAINYSTRYYANDKDFINGTVNIIGSNI